MKKEGFLAIALALFVQTTVFAQSPMTGPGLNRSLDLIGTVGDTGSQVRRSAALGATRFVKTSHAAAGQVQRKSGGGHPVLIGAAIGAGAGYLLNVTACRTGESVCSGAGDVLMAGIGAGIGALVGVLVARR